MRGFIFSIVGFVLSIGLLALSVYLFTVFVEFISSKKARGIKIVLMLLFIFLIAGYEIYQINLVTSKSEVERFGTARAYAEHHFPAPPAGRWVSAYTAEFATKQGLPIEGVSNNLDDRISYVEIVSVDIPEEEKSKLKIYKESLPQECVINMLLVKGSNISKKEKREKSNRSISYSLPLKRLLKFGNYLGDNFAYKRVHTDSWTDEVIYSDNLVDGYDYFSSTEWSCRSLIRSIKNDEDYIFKNLLKKKPYSYSRLDRYVHITIPKKLISKLYEGIEITPKHPYKNKSIIEFVDNLIKAGPMIFLLLVRFVAAIIMVPLGLDPI